MRKRFIFTIYLLLGFGLITGCSQLPFGIGELIEDAIATDEVTEEINDTNEAEATGTEEPSSETVSTETAEVARENNAQEEVGVINACENRNQFHLERSPVMLDNFYIPECAALLVYNYDGNGNRLELTFQVADGSWEELFDAYINYFGDGILISEINSDSQGGNITATPYGDEAYPTEMMVYESDGMNYISMTQSIPE